MEGKNSGGDFDEENYVSFCSRLQHLHFHPYTLMILVAMAAPDGWLHGLYMIGCRLPETFQLRGARLQQFFMYRAKRKGGFASSIPANSLPEGQPAGKDVEIEIDLFND